MKMRESVTKKDRVRVSFATVKPGDYKQTSPSESFTLYDAKVPEVARLFKIFLKECLRKKKP